MLEGPLHSTLVARLQDATKKKGHKRTGSAPPNMSPTSPKAPPTRPNLLTGIPEEPSHPGDSSGHASPRQSVRFHSRAEALESATLPPPPALLPAPATKAHAAPEQPGADSSAAPEPAAPPPRSMAKSPSMQASSAMPSADDFAATLASLRKQAAALADIPEAPSTPPSQPHQPAGPYPWHNTGSAADATPEAAHDDRLSSFVVHQAAPEPLTAQPAAPPTPTLQHYQVPQHVAQDLDSIKANHAKLHGMIGQLKGVLCCQLSLCFAVAEHRVTVALHWGRCFGFTYNMASAKPNAIL